MALEVTRILIGDTVQLLVNVIYTIFETILLAIVDRQTSFCRLFTMKRPYDFVFGAEYKKVNKRLHGTYLIRK